MGNSSPNRPLAFAQTYWESLRTKRVDGFIKQNRMAPCHLGFPQTKMPMLDHWDYPWFGMLGKV